MRKLFYAFITTLVITSPAKAEDINITADEKVEWHQNESKMVAIGNAVASKKDLSIKAHKLTALYDKVNNKNQISTINANGNVVMKSGRADAFGDNMDYDLKADIAILTGNPAKIKTEKEIITATDNITYYPSQEKAIATGEVIIDNGESKVYSNKLISYFKKTETGGMEIDKVDIFDNVKIVTKDATVTALKGTYFPQTGIIKLYDNIIIKQGDNILKGDEAESNVNTGITKLISTGKGGRVSGVFKEKEKTND